MISKSTRLTAWTALVLLASTGTAIAAPQSFDLAVKKSHRLGASRGTLVVRDEGIEYRTTDKKDARRWTYEQIKQVQVLSPTRLAVRTYEDQGWTRLWTDKTFEFEVENGQITPELSAVLLERIPRPVVTAVLPPLSGNPRFMVPVKHVRGRSGSEGELRLYDNALVYQTARTGASRYWRFGDLASIFAPDRFRLELLTYEGGGGETRQFTFQLKTDLPPGFYDTLWSALNAPAPLRGGAQPGLDPQTLTPVR